MMSLDDHVREFQYNHCTKLEWQPGKDNMGKIRFFNPRLKSQISLSGVQKGGAPTNIPKITYTQ